MILCDDEFPGARKAQKVDHLRGKVEYGAVASKHQRIYFRVPVAGSGGEIDDFTDDRIVLPIDLFAEDVR